MKTFQQFLVSVLLAATPFAGFAGTVSGSVKLPKGEAIPPGASVQVELRDVSRSDAGAMLLGKCDVRDGGGKNDAAFEIGYDDKKIAKDNAYAVSCRIVAKGKLLFINDAHVPVITRGAPAKDVELQVSKIKH